MHPAESSRDAPTRLNTQRRSSASADRCEVARDWGANSERIHVITNGVNKNLFYPRDRLACRRKLNLPTDGALIVAVAHLKPSKGVGDLVEAMPTVGRNVRLVIVGAEAMSGYAKTLEQRIRQLHIDQRVILTGAQPFENIPLFLCGGCVCAGITQGRLPQRGAPKAFPWNPRCSQAMSGR